MNLSALIKDFFIESEFDRVSEKVAIVRTDGTVLYSNSANSFEASNIGALASGIWQAAESLASLVNEPRDGYRLAFDTSSDGIYLLPLSLGERSCYLCCIYKDLLNPGKLKQNMRNLSFLLEAFVRVESLREESEVQTSGKEGYLFENITDEEMDQLFGVAGI